MYKNTITKNRLSTNQMKEKAQRRVDLDVIKTVSVKLCYYIETTQNLSRLTQPGSGLG